MQTEGLSSHTLASCGGHRSSRGSTGEAAALGPGPRLPAGTDRPGAGGGGVSGFPGVGEVGEWREGRRSVSAGGPPQGAGLQLST